MLTEDEDEEQKPSFGTSLERFRAAPASSSPSRVSRRLSSKRSSDVLADGAIVKEEEEDIQDNFSAADNAVHTSTPVKREDRSVLLSNHDLKTEKGVANGSPQLANSASPRTPSSQSPRSAKKRKVYDEKQFEGMKGIPDRLDYDLDILFCGINPGVRSSEEGFHYAHPSNRFYRILHESGLTPYKLKPSESPGMPAKYKLGLTDLVLRCTARADQVPSMEFQAGATLLLRKMIKFRPKIVCFVGMDVYRQFRRHFASVQGVAGSGRNKKSSNGSPSPTKSKGKKSGSDVRIGLQDLVISVQVEGQADTPGRREKVRLFVIPSTSGLAAGYSDADRIGYLKDAREAVQAVRCGNSPSPGKEETSEDIVVKAEDFLEDQIVKLPSGEWAFVAAPCDSNPR